MKVNFNSDDLRPIIAEVVRETLEQLSNDEAKLVDRLAFREVEAAALIGVERHVLRDARLRGQIQGTKVGRYVVYRREEVLRFLGEMRS